MLLVTMVDRKSKAQFPAQKGSINWLKRWLDGGSIIRAYVITQSGHRVRIDRPDSGFRKSGV
jgi:hypothetical protein